MTPLERARKTGLENMMVCCLDVQLPRYQRLRIKKNILSAESAYFYSFQTSQQHQNIAIKYS